MLLLYYSLAKHGHSGIKNIPETLNYQYRNAKERFLIAIYPAI